MRRSALSSGDTIEAPPAELAEDGDDGFASGARPRVPTWAAEKVGIDDPLDDLGKHDFTMKSLDAPGDADNGADDDDGKDDVLDF